MRLLESIRFDLSSYGAVHETGYDSLGACDVAVQRRGVAQDKPAFVFTAIPDQDETRLVERFTRVADLLQSKLGVPVKYLPVKSYPAAVTAFTNGQVQLAWFGGFTGVQARRQVPGSEAIAQGAEDVAFKSFFIANSQDRPRALQGIPEGRSRANRSPSARAPRPPAA